MSDTFLQAVKLRRVDLEKAKIRHNIHLARLKEEEDKRWNEEHEGEQLGCWPLTDQGSMCGIGMGMLAAPILPAHKLEIKNMYVGISDLMIHNTVIFVGDENAVVDFTYGNRTMLHNYLLCQMHQRTGSPGQTDHTIILHETLDGNNFHLKTFDICDSILHAFDEMLKAETVVFVQRPDKAITVYPLRPPGKELYRMSFRTLMQSQSLFERVTKQKPNRRDYPPLNGLMGAFTSIPI